MLKKMKFKKGDKVIVIAGRSRNISGEVLKVLPKQDKLIVAGVNLITQHKKPSAKDQGGKITKESLIHVSNVAFYDQKIGKATKIGYKFLEDGKKVRYSKKSGEVLN